jgi:hypothetical protein
MATTSPKAMRFVLLLLAGLLAGGPFVSSALAGDLSAADAEKIASEAYLYAYPMLYRPCSSR